MDLALLDILALMVLVIYLCSGLDLFFGIRKMRRLSSVICCEREEGPMVSVIVPACNEEENIARAVTSQLDQEYKHLEIIVVNDRSTDNTRAILQELASENSRLKVIDIEKLPEGWLGKAHALHTAAQQAKGDILLFTDGDIIMEKTTISRAVEHMASAGLDHLTLLFRNTSPGWLLNSLILDSGAGLIQLLRPWAARKRGSQSFVGVGAFNMMRKEVYHDVGGHSSIRMHPIDDIMLGKIIKRAGYRQECLLGVDLVTVPWYSSIADMIGGLMKNILAMINYRYALLPPVVAAIVALNIAPVWGAILGNGMLQIICITAVAIRLTAFWFGARLLLLSPWCALGTIITPYISVYILLLAAWRNHVDGGIIWRGTWYPLHELRKNEPILP